jgi:hypothetical protein
MDKVGGHYVKWNRPDPERKFAVWLNFCGI